MSVKYVKLSASLIVLFYKKIRNQSIRWSDTRNYRYGLKSLSRPSFKEKFFICSSGSANWQCIVLFDDYQYDSEAVELKIHNNSQKSGYCNGSHTQFCYRHVISTQLGFLKKKLHITWILYHA